MKKAKRFLTGLLSAALALSLCAMPAMAAEDSGATATPTAKPVWTETEGSITIHKYEWNGTTVGAPATGREDEDQLPSEKDGENTKTPNPLAGAEFTIYQVHDADWLSKYYSGAATEQEEAEYKNAFDATKYYTDNNNGTYTVNYTAYATKKTDADGKVQFGKATATEAGIPLGLYLVIETKTPDQVTTPCQPFLVSVPMTVKENGEASSYVPTEWLYDVHVYPKNKTDYGEITLIKKGQVGNDEANMSLSGVTFKLYKFVGTKGTDGKISPFTTTNCTDDLNDTTMMWKQIKKSSTAAGDNTGTEFGAAGLLTTSNVGEITVSGLSAGYYCFVEQGVGNNKAFITDQTPHYFEVKGETSQEITVANDGTVKEKADSTAAANLKLTVTDPRPDVEKKVKGRVKTNESDDDYVKATDYSVGDEIPYKITVKVPQALLNATVADAANFVFEVKDTPEHLEDKDVKAISITGAEVTTGVKITPDAEYNVKGGKGFTASFTQAALKELVGAGDTFTITYTATLLKGADMTIDGNKNTINLKYSNKIDADGKINPGTSEIEDGAVVYTFSIHVKKLGENANGEPLPNVKFNVYKEVAAGTVGAVKGSTIGITGEDADKDFVKVVIDDTKNDDTKYDLVTNNNGEAKVDGLANGTYYLVETATVNGYNLLSGPVKVTIQVSYSKSWKAKDDYVGDKLVHHEETLHEEYFGGTKTTPGNGYILTTIINRKGFNLPTTGGFGTLLFSGIGVLLVVAGVGVLLSLKKKNRT
jgi:LPXTG-motif cell wall-anchored protein